jgi:hypothetical protein
MIAVRSKIIARNHGDMIGIGAVMAVIARKVDAVNAGDEFTQSQGSLFGTGFHGLNLPRETAQMSWGVHPIGMNTFRRMLTFMNMTKTSIRPSTLILSCLAAFVLASLAGCANDERHCSTSESSSATLSSDSKDMIHRSHHDSH